MDTVDFVTLGMLIIDDIHFQDGCTPAKDVLGGAGPWAVIGARMFRPRPSSNSIAWTVHKGSDFPASLEEKISSWQTACNFIETPERLTTRGWNQYGADEVRAFKYLTEKLRIDQDQLTESMLLAKCFHLICTPTRCISLVSGIMSKRHGLSQSKGDRFVQPVFVWEPVPDSCGADELENVLTALQYVDVISPNHQELAMLFGSTNSIKSENGKQNMIRQCNILLEKGFAAKRGVVVVRCGEYGCYVVTAQKATQVHPYHQDASQVVDPTGAGNAFLGAFCVGLLEASSGEDASIMAARYGSLAAGCAVEQIGLPKLQYNGEEELWNGLSMDERWNRYSA